MLNRLLILITDTCKECGHVIAEHSYSFSVDEEYQVINTHYNYNYVYTYIIHRNI